MGGFAIRTMTTFKQLYGKEYAALLNAYHRCHNENHQAYKNYGGRGITVCPQWHPPVLDALKNFLETVGPAPSPDLTLDRIDNDKGYEPGNVRWTTRSVQQFNRRPHTSERRDQLITYNGKTQTINEWAEEIGVKRNTLAARIFYYEMPLDVALTRGRVSRRKLN